MFSSTRKQPEQHDPAEALVREVGVQLRQARMARGEDLEDVAEYLRIRPTYLHGLEQGDLSVMPGRTYALGFLRSYAQYLGFDGEDLIAQIKSSVAGLTSRAHLHDRTPLSESRLPKLPILAVSLAALAGIYAGWAYVDERSRAEIELVAEVPDDLQQQAVAADITPAIAPTPEPAISPPIEPEAGAADRFAAQEAPRSASARAPTDSPDVESAAAAATPPPDAVIDPPGPTQERAATSEVAALEPGAGEQQSEPSAPATLAEPGPPASEQSGDPAARPAADVLAALEPVADGGTAPTIYGNDGDAARVILRARTSAWVHVSSTNNDYLWVRTLQPGDAFVVPDRPDLVLWTGNAGGIEVIVDGAPLPPLGAEAGVVRDVSLQPQALLRRLSPTPAAGAASGG